MQKFLVTTSQFISRKTLHNDKYENFALEILEEKAISLCGQQVKLTGVSGVCYSKKNSELNLKIIIEMFLSRVIDTFNFQHLKENKIYLMKIRTLQCEIQRQKDQTVIQISKKYVSPSVTLFEKGTHVERSGSVLYVHKYVKMVATTTNFQFAHKKFLC